MWLILKWWCKSFKLCWNVLIKLYTGSSRYSKIQKHKQIIVLRTKQSSTLYLYKLLLRTSNQLLLFRDDLLGENSNPTMFIKLRSTNRRSEDFLSTQLHQFSSINSWRESCSSTDCREEAPPSTAMFFTNSIEVKDTWEKSSHMMKIKTKWHET